MPEKISWRHPILSFDPTAMGCFSRRHTPPVDLFSMRAGTAWTVPSAFTHEASTRIITGFRNSVVCVRNSLTTALMP